MSSRSAARDLREDCLAEAAAIIAERGPEALSLREVARRLGVSHQAPYRHFESRDHILAELTVRALHAFADRLESRERQEDPARDLEALGRAYFAHAARDPLSYRLMFGTPLLDPEAHPALAEAGRRPFGILLAAIRRMPRHAGGSAPGQAEADALFAWSTVHGVASLTQSHAVRVQALAPLVLAGLEDSALERIAQALSAPSHPEPAREAEPH